MNEHENGFLLCFFLTQFRWGMNDKTSAKVIVLSLFTFPRLSVICMCNWHRLGQGWRRWLAPWFPGREWNISCLPWYVPIFFLSAQFLSFDLKNSSFLPVHIRFFSFWDLARPPCCCCWVFPFCHRGYDPCMTLLKMTHNQGATSRQ